MYFNRATPFIEFQFSDDTTSLAALTFKLNKLLPDTDNRKMRKIKFREDWINTNEMMKHPLIELKTDDDVTIMWRSFRRRLTKGSIELDAKISRSVNDIIKMMKRPESNGSV